MRFPAIPLCLLAALRSQPADAEPLHLCVASSLSDAAEEIARHGSKETGRTVLVHDAASGVIVRQTRHGAPCDLLITADVQSLAPLTETGRLAPGWPKDLLANRLVAVGRADSLEAQPGGLAVLAMERVESIALGDPESSPAGRYARRALERAGLWERVSHKILPALDVRAAMAWVAVGEAEVGLVYRTDVRAEPRVKALFEIPEALTGPIRYPLALVGECPQPEAAGEFAAFLDSPSADEIFRRYGFEPLP